MILYVEIKICVRYYGSRGGGLCVVGGVLEDFREGGILGMNFVVWLWFEYLCIYLIYGYWIFILCKVLFCIMIIISGSKFCFCFCFYGVFILMVKIGIKYINI